MYIYIYIYACVCVWYVCICVCVYICICMYVRIYVYTCIYVHVYVDVCAYVYACVYVPSAVSHLELDCRLRSISLITHAIFGNISHSDLINFICILLIVFPTRLLNLHAYFTLSVEKGLLNSLKHICILVTVELVVGFSTRLSNSMHFLFFLFCNVGLKRGLEKSPYHICFLFSVELL